ncbi:hypothetical protein [Parvularcula marina]|jgi:hypothetical protein|uniref:Uncharacterized protein n=1 Tax=Parvularcula marina TaxID=2292771 RepID=A0A371RGP1_9PROT|nr:hypothetical protein [Parvularcula marina]RFB04618.1 hypothetical protein DX908_04585 [Parvularcula marina]
MSLGNLALVGVIIAFAVYLTLMIIGMIAAFPYGIIGLVVLGFMGLLLIGVLMQRAGDKEDRHYVDNVKE